MVLNILLHAIYTTIIILTKKLWLNKYQEITSNCFKNSKKFNRSVDRNFGF